MRYRHYFLSRIGVTYSRAVFTSSPQDFYFTLQLCHIYIVTMAHLYRNCGTLIA